MTFEDPKFPLILDKIQAGQPLAAEDAMTIYHSHDLHGIGQLASLVREQRHGRRAWPRLHLGPAPVSTASKQERIATMLGMGEVAEYEPPLCPGVSGYTYLKHVAVARLLLGGVTHIIVRYCPEVENVCQLALRFGADTLSGTNVQELERQLRAAGLEPVL
jgi:2-iminoacetate synthase ThiH